MQNYVQIKEIRRHFDAQIYLFFTLNVKAKSVDFIVNQWLRLDSCRNIESSRKNLINEKENVMKHLCSIDLFVMIMMKWRNIFA